MASSSKTGRKTFESVFTVCAIWAIVFFSIAPDQTLAKSRRPISVSFPLFSINPNTPPSLHIYSLTLILHKCRTLRSEKRRTSAMLTSRGICNVSRENST